MGVYKLSTAGGLATPRTNYSSFLAGNPAVQFTAYESIASASGTGSSGVVTFSSIPATFSHLQIRIMGFQATENDIFIKVNSDAGVRSHELYGSGAVYDSKVEAGTGDGQYLGSFGFKATNPTVWVLDLLDYASTTKAKTLRGLGGFDANGSGTVELLSALFTTTSAITSITFTSGNSYSTSSRFALYGIKGA